MKTYVQYINTKCRYIIVQTPKPLFLFCQVVTSDYWIFALMSCCSSSTISICFGSFATPHSFLHANIYNDSLRMHTLRCKGAHLFVICLDKCFSIWTCGLVLLPLFIYILLFEVVCPLAKLLLFFCLDQI